MSEQECLHQHECTNFDRLCYLCEDQQRLFRTKPVRTAPKKPKRLNSLGKVSSGAVKMGTDFENAVVKQYNKSMNRPKRKARRVPASGALWSMPGDVITTEALVECKDRGTVNARGEKQITIKKEWLDKIWLESIGTGKAPVLAYRFADNDDETYITMNINVLFEILFQVQQLKKRIREMEES